MQTTTLETDLQALLEQAYTAGQRGAALAPTKASLRETLEKHREDQANG